MIKLKGERNKNLEITIALIMTKNFQKSCLEGILEKILKKLSNSMQELGEMMKFLCLKMIGVSNAVIVNDCSYPHQYQKSFNKFFLNKGICCYLTAPRTHHSFTVTCP